MRTTIVCLDEVPETTLRAVTQRHGDMVILGFASQKSGFGEVHISLPTRMASCAETIARVFNECMAAGEVATPTENLTPDPRHRPDRGEYIGLTRATGLYPFRHVE